MSKIIEPLNTEGDFPDRRDADDGALGGGHPRPSPFGSLGRLLEAELAGLVGVLLHGAREAAPAGPSEPPLRMRTVSGGEPCGEGGPNRLRGWRGNRPLAGPRSLSKFPRHSVGGGKAGPPDSGGPPAGRGAGPPTKGGCPLGPRRVPSAFRKARSTTPPRGPRGTTPGCRSAGESKGMGLGPMWGIPGGGEPC